MQVRERESEGERDERSTTPCNTGGTAGTSETAWERGSRGNHERVITQCDLARVGQLYDQHRRVASSREHAAE